MLTVNIQVSDTQLTIEAKQVKAESAMVGGRYDVVTLTKPNDEILVIQDGQIFVMNEAGSTVAKYNLDSRKDRCAGKSLTEPHA